MERAKPPFAVRLALVLLLACFVAIEHNPLVRLQAQLGLSPSPLERWFGVRGIFSGMTEASHQLVQLNVAESLQANILAGPVLALISGSILLWSAPAMTTRGREWAFFGLIAAGTLVNNFVPELLAP